MQRHESLPSLLQERSVGHIKSGVFWERVAALRQENMELLQEPQIVPPHRGDISALDMDRVEDRFLLAGGADAVLSIYDLSPWGREHGLLGNTSQRHNNGAAPPVSVHRPVAQSIRAPPAGDGANNEVDVPSGHAHSIVAAQWYPVDTGAFVSSSAEGSILVWDTETLAPVIRWRPFQTCSCLDMPRSSGGHQLLLAVGSQENKAVKLVDLRSGASSHSLVGHNGGITVTQWCPTSHVVLASGGLDGAIRLWDIRKSGSNACLAILNRDDNDNDATPLVGSNYVPTYAHLLKQKKKPSSRLAPSNYRHAESNVVVSHGGPISAASFTPDGHFLVSAARDGRLQKWDLRIGSLVPMQFASCTNQPAVSKNNKVPLFVTQTSAWVGHFGGLLSYSLERGGTPTQSLEGHLHNVTSITSQQGWMRLVSGAKDGMILMWGYRPCGFSNQKPSGGGNTRERKRTRDYAQTGI